MASLLSSTSFLGFVSRWFTPASLFLLLNLVVATIYLISRFSSNRNPQEEIPPLVRAPSLIERAKSINLSFYKYSPLDSEATAQFSQNAEADFAAGVNPPPLERAPSSLLLRVKSINLSSFYRSEPETESAGEPEQDTRQVSDNASGSEVEHHVKRSKSEPRVSRERKVSEKMKKSASVTAVAVEDEEEKEDRESMERRRPQTTRLEKTVSFGDEEVDTKADDFINRFKQQLKLQRLDSLLRYRDMLKGK